MSSSGADGSEDVTDFLQRIKELGDRRDQEDEERNRKLEEEILQGRKERQARRAERARSISPTKSSPANTQSNSMSQSLSSTVDAGGNSRPRRGSSIDDAMERFTGSSASPTKEKSSPLDTEHSFDVSDLPRDVSMKNSPSNAMPPSRNSPLSWQRRPTSQSSDRPRSRPLSMVATENAARSPKATPTPEFSSASTAEPTLSREQIAQSLASKDPAWFRQTADRGANSPAYRRNQVEDGDRSDHGSKSERVQMPGMSREVPAEKYIAETIKSPAAIGTPIPLTDAHRLDPPTLDSRFEMRGLAMSPSQGRISPDRIDRSPSPTKGMGGFVQSAMMKRSDSVSKRWSVQSPPGLGRGDSVASNRNSHDPNVIGTLGNIVNAPAKDSRPSSLSRDDVLRLSSRPTSSHNATSAQDGQGVWNTSPTRTKIRTSATDDEFVKPSLPGSRSHTNLTIKSSQNDTVESSTHVEITPPTSPSKTLDPRRWSPTKSSWLESALNKPESPKPKPTPPPQQPAWMSDISKAKQKGSVDLGRGTTAATKHEVNIGGLLRSPPPGGVAKPMTVGGLPAGFSSGISTHPEGGISQDSKNFQDNAEFSKVRTTSPTAPANGKVKPETPPKKDFRAGLKPRQLPTDSNGKDEPEFKNVFGQLRRTKTENYVAPDELKDNITRGKAGLSVTGGPKKTERKDEFKDAILKKKEDFKKAQLDGKGVTRSTSGNSQDASLPEALAKRQALAKSDSNFMAAESKALDSPSKHGIFKKFPEPGVLVKESTTSSRVQGKDTTGSSLASRFNPALAGILSRGPPSVSSETSRSSSLATSQRTVSMSTSTTNPEAPEGPQLTHMTKSRARGPRRKAPSMTPATISTSPGGNEAETPAFEIPTPRTESYGVSSPPKIQWGQQDQQTSSQAFIENTVSQPSSPTKMDLKRRSQFLQEAPSKNNGVEPQLDSPKPLSPTKKVNSPETYLTNLEPKADSRAATTLGSKPVAPIKSPSLKSNLPERSSEDTKFHSSSPPKVASWEPSSSFSKSSRTSPIESRVGQFQKSSNFSGTASTVSVKKAAAQWARPSADPPAENSPRAGSKIKLPTQHGEERALVDAGLTSSMSHLKAKVPTSLAFSGSAVSTSTKLPTKGLMSPPPSAGLMPAATSTQPNSSPIPQTSEASRLLSDFFGDDKSAPKFVADTAEIIASRPDQGLNIKTLHSSLYQLSADGKKQPVPNHQERLLFEGNLYLCVHNFSDAAGKKITETYFWAGDEVHDSTVEQAQIFAQREAKCVGGRFINIRQGKEPPGFFQALGGIIIIRRGLSNKYDSLAPHILCGRKHLGQMVFDQVDFAASSLCSGFPYLISTQSGKSYLWKGKGSGIDELSCTRLIGTDFGLTGEIEEVEDGNEPRSFLEIFGGAKIPKSADHWRLKPNYSKYCGRLFCAESTSGNQVVEISPFSQADVLPSKIYVLDAFFEVYIIVGSRAQSQYGAFHNALMFAQEYGILTAGVEDRPFVPVSTVIMLGIPKDMKSVFRKWRDESTPTATGSANLNLQRGRSLRVVPLTAALEATRR